MSPVASILKLLPRLNQAVDHPRCASDALQAVRVQMYSAKSAFDESNMKCDKRRKQLRHRANTLIHARDGWAVQKGELEHHPRRGRQQRTLPPLSHTPVETRLGGPQSGIESRGSSFDVFS